jgi:hypothetical protein
MAEQKKTSIMAVKNKTAQDIVSFLGTLLDHCEPRINGTVMGVIYALLS